MSSPASKYSSDLLRACLAACRSHWLYAGGFSAAINILYIAPTIYMLQVYDRVVPTRGAPTLAFLTVLLVCCLGGVALLELIRSRLLVRASSRLERLLAPAILRTALGGQVQTNAAAAMRGFDSFRQTLTGPGVIALFDVPWTPVYVLLCFALNPLLGAMALAGSAILIVLTLANEHVVRPKLAAANEAASEGYAAQGQTAALADVIRTLGMRDAVVRWHQVQRGSVNSLQAEASFAAGGFVSATRFVRLALQSLALGLAAWLAIDQKISGGAIFAASLLIARALAPVEQVLGSWRALTEARTVYGSLQLLLADAGAEPERTQLPAPRGLLKVEGLLVLGPPSRPPRLNNVAFDVAPGEVLGVVGPSGAGKTTLLRSIVGAQPADRGVVRLDGADLRLWDPDGLGRHIGYLPQDLGLFRGTIKQNICRLREGIDSREQVDHLTIEAAVRSGAHDMILNLPQGYDTVIDWGGRGLSAGQAQRVALARAFYDDPQLIVLDEPNAHLDLEGEAALLLALKRAKARGAAVVVVSHRASLLEAMDKVLVLIDGAVVQHGTREEVFRLSPHSVPTVLPREVA